MTLTNKLYHLEQLYTQMVKDYESDKIKYSYLATEIRYVQKLLLRLNKKIY